MINGFMTLTTSKQKVVEFADTSLLKKKKKVSSTLFQN
jgi:hypothetical protein